MLLAAATFSEIREGYVDGYRDLIAAPEWKGPRRVVEPRSGLADGLETGGAQRLPQLPSARGHTVGTTIPAEPQYGQRLWRHRDQLDTLVVRYRQGLQRPAGRHVEPDRPPSIAVALLRDGRCHGDLLATASGRLMADGRDHRDLLAPVVGAEDVAGQAVEAGVPGVLFAGEQSRLCGDARAVLADLYIVDQRLDDVQRLLDPGPDSRHRAHRLHHRSTVRNRFNKAHSYRCLGEIHGYR